MKKALVLLAALTLASCASTPPTPRNLLVPVEFYVPTADEQLYGTWVNPELRVPLFYPKIVLNSWGLCEAYSSLADETYDWRSASIIVEKWMDAEGNTWYKEFTRGSLKGFYSGHWFSLDKISSDGSTLESIFGNLGWPSPIELDPAVNATYVKYRRLE